MGHLSLRRDPNPDMLLPSADPVGPRRVRSFQHTVLASCAVIMTTHVARPYSKLHSSQFD